MGPESFWRDIAWLVPAAILLWGCGPEKGPLRLGDPSALGPLRLVDVYHAWETSQSLQPLTVPLDRHWRCNGDARISTTADGLVVEPADLRRDGGQAREPASLVCPIDVDAALYNAARVCMQVDRGDTCAVSWDGRMDPNAQDNPGVSSVLFADETPHTYTFPLRPLQAPHWRGHIEHLVLRPSNVPARARITSVELLFRPPEAPARITIAHQTHEVVWEKDIEWGLTVPPDAVFQVHLGVLRRPWRERHGNGARFIAELRCTGKSPVTLLDQAVRPLANPADTRWRLAQADLRSYAGQEATLRLSVVAPRSAAGPCAFWGSPVVFSQGRTSDVPPVFLISCDTVRADHLSCYGYERSTTPNLDAFADEGVVFENAIVQGAWTLPSHITMLTGLYPKHHGVTETLNLAEQVVTLADALRDAGYLTAGFTGYDWWLLPERGFAHGFDLYSTPKGLRSVFRTHALARDWINHCNASNVFLFLHNFDVHSRPGLEIPYDSEDDRFRAFAQTFAEPPPFEAIEQQKTGGTRYLIALNQKRYDVTAEQVAYIEALYDDCLAKVDYAIGEFFDLLKAKGLFDKAIIVVTADHGEAFGEHDLFMHVDLYEHNIRVPLIVRFPEARHAGRRVSDMVEAADIYPTVLDALGLAQATGIDGRSLLALIEGRRKPAEATFCERLAWQAVRTPTRKLLRETHRDRLEFYDLALDPKETTDVYDGQSPAAADLRDRLATHFSAEPGGWHIALRSGGKRWSMDVELEANGPLELTELARGKFVENTEHMGASRWAGGKIVLNKAIPEDVLVIKAVSPEAQIRFTLRSKQPFAVAHGEHALTVNDVLTLTLDPQSPRFHAPPAQPDAGPPRSIRIWYERPPHKGAPAKEMTDEQAERLKALGYLD